MSKWIWVNKDKYAGLGREYTMKNAQLIPDSHIEELKSVVESKGLKCVVGG